MRDFGATMTNNDRHALDALADMALPHDAHFARAFGFLFVVIVVAQSVCIFGVDVANSPPGSGFLTFVDDGGNESDESDDDDEDDEAEEVEDTLITL